MKGTSKFNKAICDYATLCDTLYFKHGIDTAEKLEKSTFYEQYWIASYELAKAMVFSPVNHGKIQVINSLNACDDEDMVQEITALFYKKFNTIMSAVASWKNHNYKSYSGCIVSSFLKDIYSRYTACGSNDKHVIFSSLDSHIEEDGDSSATYVELLQSEDPTPEEEVIFHEDEKLSRDDAVKLLNLAASHKTKGEVLALVYYGLKSENLNCSVKKFAQKIYSAGPDNFIKLYNRELSRYNREVLHADIEEIREFRSYSLSDFGHIDFSTVDNICLKLSHWNSLLAHEVDKNRHMGVYSPK